MNERLKELRLRLGLSQTDFGAKIFISQYQISLIEKGKRNLTDRSINAICKEFDVNESWLRDGQGEMFIDLTKDIDTTDEIKNMIKKILTLQPSDQDKISKIIDTFLVDTTN